MKLLSFWPVGDDSVLVKSFIIAADEAASQWYSLLSHEVLHGREYLKQRILSNFQGFQRPELSESDLFSSKQKDNAKNLFKTISEDSFTPDPRHQMCWMPLPSAIVGLRAGQFRSHLMRERPKTIQSLYEELEKYCR
jgi:hypothetical protein